MKSIVLTVLIITASLFTAVYAQPAKGKHKNQKGVAQVGLGVAGAKSPTTVQTNSEMAGMNMQVKGNNANNNRRKSPTTKPKPSAEMQLNSKSSLKQPELKKPPVNHMEEESSERTKHHKGKSKQKN